MNYKPSANQACHISLTIHIITETQQCNIKTGGSQSVNTQTRIRSLFVDLVHTGTKTVVLIIS